MKRILTLILVLALALATFTACNLFNKPDSGEQGGENGGEQGGNTDNGGENEPAVDEGLQGAYDYIHQLYKTLSNTAGSYDVVKTVAVGDTTYTVTWTVDVESVTVTEKEDGSAYTVNVPKQEVGDAAIAYKLTFTVANAAGDTLSRTYSLVVPEGKVNTHAEYVAAEDGTALTVDGIVIGIYSKSAGDKENSIFLQDLNNEGGYYAYALADDPAGTIQIGMTLRVKGNKATYNGTYELKDCAIEILDSTIKTVEPIDVTETFVNALNTSAAELAGKQSMLVTVKGVTILNAGSNGYYNWTLAGKNSYLRISSSSNATTADQETVIKNNFAANYYNKADVTGIVAQYNGAFYIMPVTENAFSNFVVTEKPDNIQVEVETANLSITKNILVPGAITLPTAGSNFTEVAISWALAETANATLAGNVLTPVLPEEGEVKITLTATLTKGAETATKEIEVTIKALVITSIVDANELASGQSHNTYTADKYIVEGVIDEFKSGGETYGNLWIKDAEGNRLYVYGVYTADGATKYGDMTGDKPKVGDTIRLLGVLGAYNTDYQMKSGWMLSWSHNYVADVKAPTCTEAGSTTYTCACGATYSEAGAPALEHAWGEDNKCTNEGCTAVNHVHDYTYNSVVTAPTCSAAGYTTHYCECGESIQDTETEATGHADNNGDYKCDGNCGTLILPEDGSTLTIAQAYAIGSLTTTTQKYYVTGMITSVYNTQYGNMYITDGTDTMIVYGLYQNGTRYDAMATKPVAYDTITVYGILTGYNGAGQFKNAELTSHVAHECSEYTDATCKKPAACVVCGTEIGDVADHNMVDGKCSVCGHEEGAAEVVTAKATMAYTTASTTNMTGNNDAATVGLDDTIFSVVGNKGGTNNNCGLNKAGQIRLYGSSGTGNGSYFTVTSAEGYTIQSIKITFTNTTNNKNCQLTVGGTSTVFDGSSSTWEVDINSNSFELKNVITGATTQIYIASIEITYVVPQA